MLHACPDVRILTTSRESLSISGEQLYRVPSLSSPRADEAISPDDVLQFSAPQLFTDRALSIDSRFRLTRENAPYIAEICRRLDGMPLAIEVAAARVKVLSPQRLAQMLDEQFQVLTGGDRSALPRHRTMRALIDWSYDLLSDQERSILRKISIFSGGFTLDAAVDVCRTDTIDDVAVLDLLSSLVDKSLLQADSNAKDTRYSLLETVRQYGRERLNELCEYAEVARAHARAVFQVIERATREFDTTPDRAWEAQAGREMENWRSALQWAIVQRGDVRLGQRLAAFHTMWCSFARVEGLKWIRAAIDTIDETTPSAVIANLDLTQAQIDRVLSHHKSSYEASKRALSRFKQVGDRLGMAKAEFCEGRALLGLGRCSEGEALLRNALGTAMDLGLRKLPASILAALAIARDLANDLSGARAAYSDALAIAGETGNDRLASVIPVDLAESEFRSGDTHTALRLAADALKAARSFNDDVTVVNGLGNMAAYLTSLGRCDEARDCARRALTLARDVQHDVGIALALDHVIAIAALRPKDENDFVRAARLLGYTDRRLTALTKRREYTEQQQHDKVVAALHNRFSDDELERLIEEGSSWTEDHAVAQAMLI
jgi:predicted ATPase